MTSPIYYRFSEDGYFENSVHGAPDPLASKREGHPVFIQPHSSTLAVPDEIDGKWPKWNGENWDYVTLPKTADELVAFGKIKHDQQTAFWNKMTQLRNELLTDQKYIKQELVDGWWELTKIPEPTAEEIQAQIARDARSKRDYLISRLIICYNRIIQFLPNNSKKLRLTGRLYETFLSRTDSLKQLSGRKCQP